jgi:peptidoglycan/LPS O-acetylase OafA/YrhL
LICTLFLREEKKTGRIHLWKFYGRRALRLLPLYYAILLVQIIFVFALHQYSPANQQLFREKLPSYLFYYSNWLPTSTQGPFFCAWSLAVEEQFYLAFGLLMFFASRRVVIGLVAAALLIKIVVYQWFGIVDANSTLWRIVFSYREPILLGVLVAFALDRRGVYQVLTRWFGSAWVTALAAAATIAWLCAHPMSHESFPDAQLLYVLMTVTLVGLVVRPRVPVVSNAFVVHVGRVSYGIYLLHMFVISSVRKLPGSDLPLVQFLASSAITIALASVVYRFFELPIINFYKRKLSPVRHPKLHTEPPQSAPALVPS